MSDEKYQYRPDLRGYYHPYNSWRCVGRSFNNGSSNLTTTNSLDIFFGKKLKQFTLVTTAANWTQLLGAGIPYRDINGLWRFRFNIGGSLSAAVTSLNVTVTGITFIAAEQAVAVNSSDNACRALTTSSSSIIGGRSDANTGVWAFSSDVEIASKPDFIA